MYVLRTLLVTATVALGAMADRALIGSAGAMEASSLTDGQRAGALSMRVFGRARPPIGHIAFCDHSPKECQSGSPILARPRLTPELKAQLIQVNNYVNGLIKPRTDLALYGSVEVWTYPEAQGDCEDYVLLKRRILHKMGWPLEALLITVVRDEFGEGHAVLTVRTKQGDFILDNVRKKVLRWSALPYEFLKRQSFLNQREWVALTPLSALRKQTTPKHVSLTSGFTR